MNRDDEKQLPRIAVLVSDSFGTPFEDLKTGIHRELWQNLESYGVSIYFSIGNKPNKIQVILSEYSTILRYTKWLWVLQRVVDRLTLCRYNYNLPTVKKENLNLVTDIPEGTRYMGAKTLAGFKFLYDSGYDIIYRTTLSTVVISQNFISTIENINNEKPYYGGSVVSLPGLNFVSGANLFLNRKALEIIFSNIRKWKHSDLDDVALGKMFKNIVSITPLKSVNISTLDEAKNLKRIDLDNAVHIRCKSSSKVRNDAEIMQYVRDHFLI